MEKLYYSIGEVAALLGENVSLVRFWSDSFPKHLKPRRNAKGNRMYTKDDVETFRQIHFLVKVCGMTLEGAGKRLAAEKDKVGQAARMMELLLEVRSELEMAKKNI